MITMKVSRPIKSIGATAASGTECFIIEGAGVWYCVPLIANAKRQLSDAAFREAEDRCASELSPDGRSGSDRSAPSIDRSWRLSSHMSCCSSNVLGRSEQPLE